MAKEKKIPKGMHKWPYSGHVHPVGDKHQVKGPVAKALKVRPGSKIHGEETDSLDFLYQKTNYKEGK